MGNYPPAEIMLQKKRGRQQKMFLVTHNLHQTLCETVNHSYLLIIIIGNLFKNI